ncbi:hypothetical protein [Acidiphilium cryptum]|uniref:Uncharacterized protein n=1 Tax=Acidiphilium cryptum (strain JF-5) TaxID=349163 RepID=A5FWL2_ACICJ|nr:hypothetical protein [Acidiphilium cryptum]ABQ29994.1 hypothetical protein Acry_0774 [Acidiphilium cryptum JF-5]
MSHRHKSRIVIDDIRIGLEEFVKDFVRNDPGVERRLIIQALCEYTTATGVLILGHEQLVQMLWQAAKDLEPQLETRVAKTYNETQERMAARRA